MVLAGAVLGAVACSSGSGGQGLYGDAGAGDGDITDTPVDPTAGGGTTAGSCAAKFPSSQSLSQPCCAERGADACGAGLFCAAFDGRTQTTCYAEGSRADGQTCTADIQCSGDSCNASGLCKKPLPPPPKQCVPSCKVDTDCASTCPAITGGVSCCDTLTQACYGTKMPQCPIH